MTTRKMPALMKPARRAGLPEHVLPAIPAWWPVPVDDGETVPLTPEQRAAARRERAVQEAVAGPVDGSRYAVLVHDGVPPETFSPEGARGLRYVLDREASTQHSLVYRYDPTCPGHHELMRAVERAFDEVGAEYTITAREEDDHDRTAPRLGYPRS